MGTTITTTTTKKFTIKTDSPPAIELTEKEKLIFDRLLEVVRFYNLGSTIRVAGGWVRDKFLGKDSDDIDIAIDNMLGRMFADKVKEYWVSRGEQVEEPHDIKCNPDKSKHLQTSKMRLFGMCMDFVNLRTEDYCKSSRIPTMVSGTAEDDAYRRDLTINSLFYNINTLELEDWTKRGIADLFSGKIVTPLPPKQTFLDDPLRVLRAIRFGTSLGFMLDEALKQAAACDEVRNAIWVKISRERIGAEVDKMISGNDPVQAINYMCDFKLFWVVFSLPPNVEPPSERVCAAHIDAASKLIHSIGGIKFEVKHVRLALYAALFLPFMVLKDPEKENKKLVPSKNLQQKQRNTKEVPFSHFIIFESLRRSADDTEKVLKIHCVSNKFSALLPFFTSEKDMQNAEAAERVLDKVHIDVPTTSKLRITTGRLLREIKEEWEVALLVSTLLYHPLGNEHELSDECFNLEKRRDLFNLVRDAIINLGLEKVWDIQTLLDGHDIMNTLHLKEGREVGVWTEKILDWQLAYPSGTADECLEWMREAGANAKRSKLT